MNAEPRCAACDHWFSDHAGDSCRTLPGESGPLLVAPCGCSGYIRPGSVECADCGEVLAHLGHGLDHLEATGHRGVRFIGGSADRVWSPIA